MPESCSGRGLSGVIRGGPTPAAAEAVIVMHESDGDKNDPEAGFRAVKTLTHTYAVAVDGRWLLYDNVADPFQQKNLIADPAQRRLWRRTDGGE